MKISFLFAGVPPAPGCVVTFVLGPKTFVPHEELGPLENAGRAIQPLPGNIDLNVKPLRQSLRAAPQRLLCRNEERLLLLRFLW